MAKPKTKTALEPPLISREQRLKRINDFLYTQTRIETCTVFQSKSGILALAKINGTKAQTVLVTNRGVSLMTNGDGLYEDSEFTYAELSQLHNDLQRGTGVCRYLSEEARALNEFLYIRAEHALNGKSESEINSSNLWKEF